MTDRKNNTGTDSEQQNRDIDEASAASFPASDAPAFSAKPEGPIVVPPEPPPPVKERPGRLPGLPPAGTAAVVDPMSHHNPSDQELTTILTKARTIAIVGVSSNPDKPSHGIMGKLLGAGYRVIPVNPRETEVLGQKAYATLREVPDKIDIVDVFRRAEETPAIADEAVAVGAKVLWLQSGITSDDAAARASAGGLTVVMDACLGAMHSLLRIPRQSPTV
ncbi:MAG: CoA-binding protein [Myxococcales bacterium]